MMANHFIANNNNRICDICTSSICLALRRPTSSMEVIELRFKLKGWESFHGSLSKSTWQLTGNLGWRRGFQSTIELMLSSLISARSTLMEDRDQASTWNVNMYLSGCFHRILKKYGAMICAPAIPCTGLPEELWIFISPEVKSLY